MIKSKDYAEISDIPELKMPDIKGQIPEELMQNLTPEMRHLFSEQSKQTQLMMWCAHALIDTNKQVRMTNGRLRKVEEWKTMLTNSWSLSIMAFIVFSTVISVISKLFDFIG